MSLLHTAQLVLEVQVVTNNLSAAEQHHPKPRQVPDHNVRFSNRTPAIADVPTGWEAEVVFRDPKRTSA